MTVNYDGTLLKIGGKQLEVPPLNLKSMKRLSTKGYLPVLLSLRSDGAMSAEQLEAVIEAITCAIQQNYPEIDSGWIEDNISLPEIPYILAAALSAPVSKSPNVESPSR
ncbi:hypothetical protein [Anaeromyxobacter sp. PSR-1]|uniref:hypothetical protein n=1 Tax=Anaeromyxobacter sp. PSR-1 TaxID=1300915 RepID=UPI0005DA7043|nr:hypothetical protein [Anaeromyxobacter sp. PSR-1]GAO01925.1 hypothetical protein PSR1_00788 [Anaeromyxobacter sp. PSR-1]